MTDNDTRFPITARAFARDYFHVLLLKEVEGQHRIQYCAPFCYLSTYLQQQPVSGGIFILIRGGGGGLLYLFAGTTQVTITCASGIVLLNRVLIRSDAADALVLTAILNTRSPFYSKCA